MPDNPGSTTSSPADKVRLFPTTPGVYLMKDAQGRVIYVGKAKNLRSRAGSYFQKTAETDRRICDWIGEVADIVVLTNLGDHAHPWRVEQLEKHGIRHEVVTNQGGKGVPARSIIARYGAGRTAFVDDLPVHHASVAKHAPEVHRLHMVAEPRLAPAVPKAEHAHIRIDDWPTAADWILERLASS